MPSVSWLEIRKWNGSQSDAFEELCCQLAHSESVPDGARFVSKGRPDSGIECYWTLRNGDDWGWQAKFFPDGVNKTRWQQCDESVKRALAGHPRLTKLFFCIPYRFPDARKPNQTSATEQWEKHREKWIAWAKKRQMRVEIILWDEHELVQRLSKPENRGRHWFWFNTPSMDSEFFRRNVAGAVSLADERYTPELNFELPIGRRFDSLGRTSWFVKTLNVIGGEVSKLVVDLSRSWPSTNEGGTSKEAMLQSLQAVLDTFNFLSLNAAAPIDFEAIKTAVLSAQEIVRRELRRIWDLWQEKVREFEKMHGRRPDPYEIRDDRFSDYRLREAFSCLGKVLVFCESKDASLANLPAMLLIGDAGLGKTHLMCSIADKRIAAGLPTIILLGQQFDDSEPWTQIIRLAGLSCDRDVFLGALNAIGEAAGQRALIMIDAINDGAGIRFWTEHLAAMLSHLRNYPHVAVAISVRTAYFEKDSFPTKQLISVMHEGFAGIANAATRHFFQYYGLAEPNVPMLDPEFDNPLFLKLVCCALRDSGRHELPNDLVGVSAVFDFILDETNIRLAKKLDYAVNERLVQRAVDRLAGLMAGAASEFLPAQDTAAELKKILPSTGYSNSLLQHLISEHIVIQSPKGNGSHEDMIRFTYQRLSDHLIVRSILAKTPRESLPHLFKPTGTFGRMMGTGHDTWYYGAAGWIEALAVQLPEKWQMEIDQVLSGTLDNDVFRRAFLSSIIWRKPTTFSSNTKRRMNTLIRSTHWSEVLDTIICISARPRHPYNANFLDALLAGQTMAERDAWWSIYIFGKANEEGNVYRLIEWAWAERKDSKFPDDVVRLAALTLAWCLTTSDRFVRDRATKALVSLLEQRLTVAGWLLGHFETIDEPYVQERLYAVAYGCAMRTNHAEELRKLAQQVYDRIFRDGFPPASVLLRDHARGVVERALRTGLQVDCDKTLIIPPYKSDWPKAPPSLSVLEKRFAYDKHSDEFHGLRRILNSVTSDDFAHYVIGDVTWWSDRRRKGKVCQSPESLFKQLRATIDADAAETLEMYADCMRSIHDPNPYAGDTPEASRTSQRFVDHVDANLGLFLTAPQIRQFREKIMPHLKDPRNKQHRRIFSIELFQRLLLRRVLELGWTRERFNEFDRNVSEKGRASHKAERIGKKYQWIAYDEFLARISDNFGLAESGTPIMEDDELEAGTWPDHFRDIDPSLLLRETPEDGWGLNQHNWWNPHNFDSWTSAPTPLAWLQQTDDIPSPIDFLEVTGPDKQRWLVLNAYTCWRRKETIGEFRGQEPDQQELHYIFRSYLVPQKHLKNVMSWARNQNWINDRLPSAREHHGPYMFERFWSPFFDWSLDEDWISRVWQRNDLPHPVIQTTENFSRSNSSYDCSVDQGFSISTPSRWLATKMGLTMSGRRGDFVDSKSRIIAFDPSTRESGHSTLVLQRDALREFLRREKLALIWTLLGEKNIYPPGMNTSKWLGRLTILGVYSWEGQRITGDFRREFFKGNA
jgi:hypothetical protein